MNANTLFNETIAYTINWMTAKMMAGGYTEERIAEYMTSEAGIKRIFELAAQFSAALK